MSSIKNNQFPTVLCRIQLAMVLDKEVEGRHNIEVIDLRHVRAPLCQEHAQVLAPPLRRTQPHEERLLSLANDRAQHLRTMTYTKVSFGSKLKEVIEMQLRPGRRSSAQCARFPPPDQRTVAQTPAGRVKVLPLRV